jgi:hypothetical protein
VSLCVLVALFKYVLYDQSASVSTPAKYPGELQGLVAGVDTSAIRVKVRPLLGFVGLAVTLFLLVLLLQFLAHCKEALAVVEQFLKRAALRTVQLTQELQGLPLA